MNGVKTPRDVKAEFQRSGISIGSWAKKNGFSRQAVYSVLSGSSKAKYGRSHEIAVALGLKKGEVVPVESFLPAKKRAA